MVNPTAQNAGADTAPELCILYEKCIERQTETDSLMTADKKRGGRGVNESKREGKGVRDGEKKLGCYVYCWQFTHAHSI